MIEVEQLYIGYYAYIHVVTLPFSASLGGIVHAIELYKQACVFSLQATIATYVSVSFSQEIQYCPILVHINVQLLLQKGECGGEREGEGRRREKEGKREGERDGDREEEEDLCINVQTSSRSLLLTK